MCDTTGAGVAAWLLENGSPPVRYRTLRDILRREPADPELTAAARALDDYQPAAAVICAQSADGTWAGRLHTADSRAGARQTTEIQFPRLAEFGLGPGCPAVRRTAAFLGRLLPAAGASDEDLRDLASYATGPRRRRYIASFARSIAAGLLAHAGFGDQPEVVAAARDLLGAAYRFVTGPAAAAPVRGDPPLVVAGAYDEELGYPAIPDLYLLQLFAFCPALARGADRARLEAVVDYALGETYAALDQRIGLVALEGRPFVKGWKIELWPPGDLARAGRWNYGLAALELFARLTPLARHGRLAGYREWLEQWHRGDGLYDPPAAAVAVTAGGPLAERLRLSPDWRRRDRRLCDLTFRVLLIDTLERRRARGGPARREA